MNGNGIHRDFTPTAAVVPEKSDEDEFETVVYTGPSAVAVEDTVPRKKCVPPVQVQHQIAKPPPPVNVRLAQIATEYGGLLSPEFFLNGLSSSSDSSRGTPSSSESVPPFSSGSSEFKTPFSFPKVDTGPKMTIAKTKCPTDQEQLDQKLERIQILDEQPPPDPPEKKEPCWEEWPQKYISSKGFILGIKPGTFFKDKYSTSFCVRLPHLSNYEVILTNNNPIPCDVDLYVNGKLTNAQRIPADSTRIVDGPQYSEYAFKIFRARDAPPGMNVTVGDRANGHVAAVFTPCRVEGGSSSRLRSTSEPPQPDTSLSEDLFEFLNNPDDASKKRALLTMAAATDDEGYRSLDLSRVTQAVTLLQGSQSKKQFVKASEMPTDLSKRVTLQLRLIASLDEEVTATDEEIYCLEPPLLPS